MKQDAIDAVVFDIGGVFIDWDPRHLYRKLIADDEAREYFLSEICSPEWHAEQDLGRDTTEACRELALRHPEYAPLISAWSERNEEMVAGVVEGSIAVLHELHERNVPCFALSNMESEAFARRRERYGFMSDFAGFVISSTEHVAKPDEEIFSRLLARFSLKPERTLFVDDRALNIAVAARLGFVVCLFSSPAELRERLVGFGLLKKRPR